MNFINVPNLNFSTSSMSRNVSTRPIFSLPIMCRCEWPQDTVSVTVGHSVFLSLHEALQTALTINTIDAFIMLLSVGTSLCITGRTLNVRLFQLVDAQDYHHDIITMLHTDQMMQNGYAYPPSVRVDNRDRHVFASRVRAGETSVVSGVVEHFNITYTVEVYLDQNALSTKMFSHFNVERHANLYRDQAVRVPLNKILSYAHRAGVLEGLGDELLSEVEELASFDMTMMGSFFPPQDTLMTNALKDVERHTCICEANSADYEDGSLLRHQRNNVLWMREQERRGNIGGKLWYPFTTMWLRPSETGDWSIVPIEYCPCMQIFRCPPTEREQNEYAGGMLLDETGLGKTKSILALCNDSEVEKPSLVVVPLSVLTQWKEEANEMKVKTYVYYGQSRIRDIEKLKEYDVIITTMTVISRDYNALKAHREQNAEARQQVNLQDQHETNQTRQPQELDPHILSLFGIKFARVIVDESHKMCANLRNALDHVQSQVRWCATATPGDHPAVLVRQLSFLNLPVPTTPQWLQQNLLIGTRQHSRLGFLLKRISRRHQRQNIEEQVGQLRTHTISVELDDHARSQYECMLTRKRLLIGSLSRHGAHALIHLNELRSHMSSSSFADVNFSSLPDMHENPAPILARIAQDTCSICLDPFDTPLVTPCGHVFCLTCMRGSLGARTTCPLCRTQVEWLNLRMLTMPVDETSIVHAKLAAIVQQVRNLNEKVLIFSEFQSTLRMLRTALANEAVRTFVIEGRMSRYARDRSLRDFDAAEGSAAFLLNIKTAGTGLNLQKCKSIIFCEPLLSETLKNQAIGRIRRIGQASEVIDTYTFTLSNTVEQSIDLALRADPSWRSTVGAINRLLVPVV